MNEIIIYRMLLISVFIFAAIVFAALFWIAAPYGRHLRKGWGLSLPARWGWLIMEFPAFAVIILFYLLGDSMTSPAAVVFLLIWLAHYFHRTFIYSFIMKGGSKKFPVLLVAFAFIFNSINGYINGRYLFYFAPRDKYDISWLYDPRFITGVLIFIAGMSINIYSDHILRNLRKSGENGYSIPHGGLFKYVSCPNYLGEIMEWTGWAVATWSLPGLAFAIFTAANLMPRAFSNHHWYLEYFPEYPGDRKALIPFLI